MSKKPKNLESVVQVFTLPHFQIADTFAVKQLHTSCYIHYTYMYSIILKLFIFG